MRAPSSALAIALALATPAAPAQLLDLGGAPEPTLGERSSLAQLAQRLHAERQRLEEQAAEGNRRAEAQAALRRLAAALLESADASPEHAVAGLTLVAALPEADRLLAETEGPAGEGVAIFVAGEAGVDAFDLPREPRALDGFVRDALAMLTRLAEAPADTCGWRPGAERTPAAIESLAGEVEAAASRLAAAGLLEADDPLAEVVKTMRAASPWRAYRPAAARLGRLTLDALHTAELAADAAPDRAAPIATLAARAAAGLLQPELRDAATTQLVRLAQLGRLLERAAAIADPEPRAAITGHLLEIAAEQRPADTPFLDLALELAAARAAEPDERTLIRHARPAHRALLAHARETEAALLAALLRVLEGEAGPSDPAVASAIAAHRRTVDDLRHLRALSAMLAAEGDGREPAARRDARPLAERLLAIGRTMTGPDEPLRALLEEANALRSLTDHPGLQALQSPGAARGWIQSRRDAWHAGEPLDATALRAMARALDATANSALVASLAGGEPSALVAWPGFEAPPRALGLLARGPAGQAEETVRLATEGQWQRVGERLAASDDEHAALRLIARLERDLRASGCRGRAPGESAPALLELLEGAPIGEAGPLLRSRRELAELSRYLAELPAARESGRAAEERTIRRFLADRAETILQRLDR